MTTPLPDRWATRDLPVLVEVARALDVGDQPDRDQIADDLNITAEHVDRSITVLTHTGYLYENRPTKRTNRGIEDMPFLPSWLTLTERGMRAVGLWPSGENVDALLDALRQAEESTTDPDERNYIRRALGALTSVSRDVMTDVLAAVIARQSGLG